ncbi:hypothetical protein MBANPS3_012250, partial [Mucor bainieri]
VFYFQKLRQFSFQMCDNNLWKSDDIKSKLMDKMIADAQQRIAESEARAEREEEMVQCPQCLEQLNPNEDNFA